MGKSDLHKTSSHDISRGSSRNIVSRETLLEHPSLGLEEAYILATNVRRLRLKMDISIAEFARESGLTRPTIYKVESGLSDLKLSKICDMATALGVTAKDLLTPPSDDVFLPPPRRLCDSVLGDRYQLSRGAKRSSSSGESISKSGSASSAEKSSG